MCKLRRITHKLSKARRALLGLYVKFGVIRHSSKSTIISVAMHKPNDEYFGGYEIRFFFDIISLYSVKC